MARARGSSSGSAVSTNVPQCIVAIRGAPRSSHARTASAGLQCIGRMNQFGSYAPTGISARSMSGCRFPISANQCPYPVSPAK